MKEISKIADSLCPVLQTTFDCPGLHGEGGKVPLLNLQVWVERVEKEEAGREGKKERRGEGKGERRRDGEREPDRRWGMVLMITEGGRRARGSRGRQ